MSDLSRRSVQCIEYCTIVFALADAETETETDKNGLYGIMWRCSYCLETETHVNFHWVLYTFYRYLYQSQSQCE